jgi:uncharacterized protein (UPF0218 family)
MYILTDRLRAVLKLPLGVLVPNEERTRSNLESMITAPLVLVGDVTASVMTRMGFVPDLILVDNHTKRGKEIPTLMVVPGRTIKVRNDPGLVGPEMMKAITESLRYIEIGDDIEGPILIEVDGEEDLASLACIDLLPVGGTVVYGQPDAGLVIVNVDNNIKKKVKEMLREMEV